VGRAARAVLAVGLIAAIAVAFWRYGIIEHEDVQIYLEASRAVARGEPVYAPMARWIEIGYWMGDQRPQPTPHSPYVYPPPLAIAFLPLLSLPESLATKLWYAIGFVAVLASGWVLSRLLFGRSPLAFLIVATVLVYFQPIRRNLSFAQADTVTLCFLVLGLAAFVARRDVRAGLAVAGAIAIKPFLGFVLLYFLWKRAYRAVVVASVVAGALILGSLVALGPDTVRDYVATTMYWSSPQSASTIANQSASGILLRGLTSLNGPARIAEAAWLVVPLRGIITGLTVGLLAWAVRRERRLPSLTLAAEYGLTLVAMVFVSPLGEDLHYVYAAIVLLAAAALVYHARVRSPAILAVGVGVAALYGVFLYPLHTLPTRDGPFYGLCAIGLLGAFVVRVAQRSAVACTVPVASST
jgi:alpha-1,2-mannosyltransferase